MSVFIFVVSIVIAVWIIHRMLKYGVAEGDGPMIIIGPILFVFLFNGFMNLLWAIVLTLV